MSLIYLILFPSNSVCCFSAGCGRAIGTATGSAVVYELVGSIIAFTQDTPVFPQFPLAMSFMVCGFQLHTRQKKKKEKKRKKKKETHTVKLFNFSEKLQVL